MTCLIFLSVSYLSFNVFHLFSDCLEQGVQSRILSEFYLHVGESIENQLICIQNM